MSGSPGNAAFLDPSFEGNCSRRNAVAARGVLLVMRFIASRAPAAFFAAVALGSGPGTPRPTAFDPPPKTVYAAELADSSWRLVALDGRTLRHLSGRSLELPGFVTGVRPSPDGRRLALTLDAVGGPASVLVVDTVRLRVLGHVALAREGRPLTVAWTSNRELVAIGGWGSPRTSAFDAGGRVHSVRSLGGTLVAAALRAAASPRCSHRAAESRRRAWSSWTPEAAFAPPRSRSRRACRHAAR